MSLLLLFPGVSNVPPSTELDCPCYFDFDCTLGLSYRITDSNSKKTWYHLRRQITIYNLKREVTFYDLRREVTFYRDFIMPNQDPFDISLSGILVDQKIFLNPLVDAADSITGTPVVTCSQPGFTISNVHKNSSGIYNEDGVLFPENTVIVFDIEAPSEALTVDDEEFEEAIIYASFVSTDGLEITVKHPIRIKDALEV